mmetsp:Transcript_26947/g.37203  ORF Transcript_26947/g.37203 Transcript_26947/m.37203 type:complete len:1037 (-) Transcript_26947:170-3280(-)
MTNLEDPVLVLDCIQRGAEGCLQKPISRIDLENLCCRGRNAQNLSARGNSYLEQHQVCASGTLRTWIELFQSNIMDRDKNLSLFWQVLKFVAIERENSSCSSDLWTPSQVQLDDGLVKKIEWNDVPDDMEKNWYCGPASEALPERRDSYRLGVLLFELCFPIEDGRKKDQVMLGLQQLVIPLHLMESNPQDSTRVLWLLKFRPNFQAIVDSDLFQPAGKQNSAAKIFDLFPSCSLPLSQSISLSSTPSRPTGTPEKSKSSHAHLELLGEFLELVCDRTNEESLVMHRRSVELDEDIQEVTRQLAELRQQTGAMTNDTSDAVSQEHFEGSIGDPARRLTDQGRKRSYADLASMMSNLRSSSIRSDSCESCPDSWTEDGSDFNSSHSSAGTTDLANRKYRSRNKSSNRVLDRSDTVPLSFETDVETKYGEASRKTWDGGNRRNASEKSNVGFEMRKQARHRIDLHHYQFEQEYFRMQQATASPLGEFVLSVSMALDNSCIREFDDQRERSTADVSSGHFHSLQVIPVAAARVPQESDPSASVPLAQNFSGALPESRNYPRSENHAQVVHEPWKNASPDYLGEEPSRSSPANPREVVSTDPLSFFPKSARNRTLRGNVDPSDEPRQAALEQTSNMRKERLKSFGEKLSNFVKFSEFELISEFSASQNSGVGETVCSSGFDRDDEFFATVGLNKKLKVFDYARVASPEAQVHCPVLEILTRSKLSSVCWSPYVKSHLVTSNHDGVAILWDVEASATLVDWREHRKRVWAVDVCPVDPHRVVSGSDDGAVKIWHTSQENSVATIQGRANVCCVQFSPINSNIIAFGSASNKLLIYDLRNTSSPTLTLAGNNKTVSYVRFLDGNKLISASTDSRLNLWDLNQGSTLNGERRNSTNSTILRPSMTYSGHVNEKHFVGMSISNEGYIACGSEDNSVYAYHSSLQWAITSYKFKDPNMAEDNKDASKKYVSTLSWQRHGSNLLAINFSGHVRILTLNPWNRKQTVPDESRNHTKIMERPCKRWSRPSTDDSKSTDECDRRRTANW